VKSHNFSFHVTAVSYDINIINRSTIPNRAVSLMDGAPLYIIQCIGSNPHNCNYTVLILLNIKTVILPRKSLAPLLFRFVRTR